MPTERQKRTDELAYKFIAKRSDDELLRRVAKCCNKWVWDIAEIELANRKAKIYADYFKYCNTGEVNE